MIFWGGERDWKMWWTVYYTVTLCWLRWKGVTSSWICKYSIFHLRNKSLNSLLRKFTKCFVGVHWNALLLSAEAKGGQMASCLAISGQWQLSTLTLARGYEPVGPKPPEVIGFWAQSRMNYWQQCLTPPFDIRVSLTSNQAALPRQALKAPTWPFWVTLKSRRQKTPGLKSRRQKTPGLAHLGLRFWTSYIVTQTSNQTA